MNKLLQRIFNHIRHHSFSLLIIILFSIMMLQPHKFEVDYNNSSKEYVLATYEDILNSDADKDAAIAFESLIVGEDGSTKITYTVQPGDTLSEIAKNFGTTISTIRDTNGLNGSALRPGDKLIITYNEGIIYEVIEDITLAEFATQYDLDIEDLMTLNYIDNENEQLYAGSQLFIDLNKVEALDRGLIKKKEYEILFIEPPKSEPGLTAEEIEQQNNANNTEKTEYPVEENNPEIEGEQEVISAEETEKHLQEIEKQEQQDNIPAEPEIVEKSLCGDHKCELAGQCYTMPDNAICDTERSDNARKCKEGFEEAGKSCIEIPKSLCPENQCELNGKCFTKPDNAVCTENNSQDARKCKEGFEEAGKSCIEIPKPVEPDPILEVKEPAPTTPSTPILVKSVEEDEIVQISSNPTNKKEEVVSQWYFNPRKAGFPGYGRGAGHCTEYAAYYRWKNYNINLREHIHGNAGQWYTNANNAGLKVGQTPGRGAIIVMKYGSSGWSSYGHVGIVTQIDRTNRMVRIQDANFLGRFVVTDHRVDMDSEQNPIIGYIYPAT